MLQKVLVLFLLLCSVSAEAAVPGAINLSYSYLTLLEFFGLGVLLAFTPCVFPMVPILSGIIMGSEEVTTAKAFKLSLTFVLSMAFTYAIVGVGAGYLGHTVQGAFQSPIIISCFSGIFVLMALSMFGLFDLRMPSLIQNYICKISNNKKSGTYVGVAAMGILSTLIASPCVTAPLISVLTYISNTGSPIIGGAILFSLALGMGLPLLLFGVGQGTLLPKTGLWMNKVKWLFGMMMLGMAVWMISRILSPLSVSILWACLLTATIYLLGTWTANLRHIKKYMAQAVLLTALVASLIGIFYNPATPSNSIEKFFTVVKTQAELQTAITTAKQEHKPILIDFYATWCSDCQLLDKTFFSDAKVQTILMRYTRIRVDVSQEDSKEIEKIKSLYHVFGTPTIIFEDKKEKEIARKNDASSLNELEAITNHATN
ncbi:MAG: protein-disulfide reductase DsbD [Gammaproteobacteria bacterium]|nr:protein-disulfide reductase DsbD [Gammaproteobacteria bacterium]